ncbi:MAG: DNA helicase RecQ [Bacteroidales bacterium]|nr:DNA helicase RecQ [Bacteroidales bacterium]
MSLTPAQLQSQALSLLSRFYGYHSFRPGQWEIMSALLQGRDAMVLMPTGGGKSLCFQLPALLMPGCAVVISPLIALMQDQTQGLVANGIPAACIHSNQSESDNRYNLQKAIEGKIKLLYISPERLLLELPGWNELNISLFAIDEAHCISQWGHDFRPDYTALGQIKQLRPDVPMIALTATADRLTRDDIIRQLGLNAPYCHLGSFDRPNITLNAFGNRSREDKLDTINAMVLRHPQDSGIVYTLSRKGAESLHSTLLARGIRSVCYHAGMSAADRDRSLRAFLNGDAQVVCATVAFGMGIDKSNIRWVIHFNLPGNIESYYQEIGRAGRDGLPAQAILFHSIQDVIQRRNFANDSGQRSVNLEKLARMEAYAQAKVCRRRILLSYFSQESTQDCGNCDICRRPPVRIDGTIIAQKALSAVMRAGGKRVGVFTLINILRGVSSSEIQRFSWDKIKTFGAGSDLSKEEWRHYIQQLIQLGVFEIAYDDYNHLRVTPFGQRLLRGEETIHLSEYQPEEAPRERKKRKKEAVATAPVSGTEALFERLKTLRYQLANQAGMPAYRIFSDATLLDMATRRPRTREDFLQVNGVGEVKAARYAEPFLALISDFADGD